MNIILNKHFRISSWSYYFWLWNGSLFCCWSYYFWLGTAGIVAGSIAAGIQAAMGNIAAGSLFAIIQSLGMTGILLKTAAVAVCGLISALLFAFKDFLFSLIGVGVAAVTIP